MVLGSSVSGPERVFALPGPWERGPLSAPFGSVRRNLELAKLLSFPDLIVPWNDGYKMADEVYFEWSSNSPGDCMRKIRWSNFSV